MQVNRRPSKILLIEDNPADAKLFEIIFSDRKQDFKFNVLSDGEQALNFINSYSSETEFRPDIIIMDLNVPRVDGRELISKFKQSKLLKKTPIIVLTSSESEDDINSSYESGANCVLSKPMDLDWGIRVFKLIDEFWLQVVKLPR